MAVGSRSPGEIEAGIECQQHGFIAKCRHFLQGKTERGRFRGKEGGLIRRWTVKVGKQLDSLVAQGIRPHDASALIARMREKVEAAVVFPVPSSAEAIQE